MTSYKVMFANNEPINCLVSNERFDHDSEYYYEFMGQIMYALVKANSEDEAKKAAKKMVTNTGENHIIPSFAAAA